MKFLWSLAFLLIICSSALAQSPCVDATGKLSVQPTSLSFGSVRIGNTAKKTFQILNADPGSAMNVTFLGRNNSQFVILGAPAVPFCVTPLKTATITIGFVPSQTGVVSGQILIQSTAGNAFVDVSGTGAAAGVPNIQVSPQSMNLGDVPIGTFKQFTLRISNTGNIPLNVQPFAFDPCLRTIPNGPFAIRSGRAQSIRVRIIACDTGPISQTLTVQSDDPDQPSVLVQISGNGIQSQNGFLDRTTAAQLGTLKTHTTGAAWIDANADGLLDLFVTGRNGNMLFVNRGGGRFANQTTRSRLQRKGIDVAGSAWADVDNDGDTDLFLAEKSGRSGVYKNTKKGIFAFVSSALRTSSGAAAQDSNGGVWLDYNSDGLIDLFVVRDQKPNSLFKNNGLLRFVDVASSAGLDFQGAGRSAVAGDFNGDDQIDLYLVNFQQPNKLYLNLGSDRFQDSSAGSGANLSDTFHQVIASDYDGDQDLDLFLVNQEGSCVLLKNNGKAHFQNVTAASRLGLAKNATSAAFEDLDNDGDEDLIVLMESARNLFFLNNGKGKFKKISNVDFDAEQSPSAITIGDVHLDGSSDVFIGDALAQLNSLFVNVGESKNWIAIDLEGSASNRSAIGAKVLIRAGLLIEFKMVSGGNGQNQASLPLKFGLGNATTVDSIQVAWPDGKVQSLQDIPANQVFKIKESE